MYLKLLKAGIVVVFIFSIGNVFGLDKTEKDIVSAIRKGNIEFLKEFHKNNPKNIFEFSNGRSGLYYAIKFNEIDISWFLLQKGANPNLIVGNYSTLVWALRYNRRRILRFLIEFGADVNYCGKNAQTPLIHAAKLNNAKLCKILIDGGANPLKRNKRDDLASDYVDFLDPQNTKEYLLLMEQKYLNQDTIPSMKDGPYIYWENDKQIILSYYERSHKTNVSRLIEKTVYIGDCDTIITGLKSDKNQYHIEHNPKPNPSKITSNGQIFAIGDIHGRYNALINLLTNNKIIDSEQNWTFGDGQVVLQGDVFDRGDMVTETLWFLYELKYKAKQQGGNVNVLLGNHEIMALTGDHRYINEKYDYFTKFTFTNYFQLYDKNTIMGRWLRKQNLIIQINDYLFLHAGISPQFDVHNYSFNTLNSSLQNYLNSSLQLKGNSIESEILSSYGPLWFRGYMLSMNRSPEVPQEFVDNYLKKKQLKGIILGHNMQDEINTSFEGKIISIDVYINESGNSLQGLLISNGKLYKCYSDGIKELIK